RLLDFWPDVLHLHDWQAGLVPVYLTEVYSKHPDGALRRRYQALRTLFTIHNIAFQGSFPADQMPLTGLDWRLVNYLQLEAYDRAPLFGMVARLAEQKGIDLIVKVANAFLQQGCQLVVLGDGDPVYKQMLYDLRARFPDRVSLTFDFDEGLAHQIEAGADVFL